MASRVADGYQGARWLPGAGLLRVILAVRLADDGYDVLRGAVGGLDARSGLVKPGADLFPATLVPSECAHDYDIVGV